jgi:hypothetical protein
MSGLDFDGSFAPAAATEVQIGSAAVTVSQVRHIIKAETGTTDTLETITVDSTIASGYGGIVIFQAYSGHAITFDDGGGNITTGNNADIILEGDARLAMEYDTTNSVWVPFNNAAQVSAFTVTNWTEDFAMDCDAAADAEICDVLGTLIKELIASGLIAGTVSA